MILAANPHYATIMKLESIKKHLESSETIQFKLPDGSLVPSHFHVTEIGKVTKNFIDCGGVVRNELVVNFQLWNANDYNHRLHPEKLIKIINLAQEKLEIGDLEIEIEYQGETIQKFGVDYDGSQFVLLTKQTDCLAKDNCGIPVEKLKVDLSSLAAKSCCDSNCCS